MRLSIFLSIKFTIIVSHAKVHSQIRIRMSSLNLVMF